MTVVHILATTPLPGVPEFHLHRGTEFAFGVLDPAHPAPVFDDAVFAFIDGALPQLSGLELCRRLRANGRFADAHLTMVLESDDPEDRRRALAAGADDYLRGPVEWNTLFARVLALHDPATLRSGSVLAQGDLVIDRAAMRARWKGRVIPLAGNEFRLLTFLAERPNEVHSRQNLLAALGKQAAPISERTTDVWMKRLRIGLKQVGIAEALRTVRQHGYALELPSPKRSATRA